MHRFVCAVVLVLMWATVAEAQWSRALSPGSGRILQQAQQYMKSGKDQKAGALLRKYVEESSSPHPLGSLMYGNWLMSHDRLKKAAKVYAAALEKEPKSPELCMNLGVVRFRQERFAEAGELFLRSGPLMKKPDQSLVYQAAVCFFYDKQYHRVEHILHPLLADRSAKPEWVQLMAHSLVSQKKWGKAEGVLIRFLRVRPDEVPYWKLLAQVRIAEKKYRGAAAALEIAYRIHAPSRQERETLSQIYSYIGAHLLAMRSLEQSYTKIPPAKVCDKMARAYAFAGRDKKALAMMQQAVQQKPTAKRWMTKAQFEYKTRRYAAAENSLKQAVRLKEKTGLAQYMLGLVYWQRNDWSSAREYLLLAEKSRRYKRMAGQALGALESLGQAKRDAQQGLEAATARKNKPHV
ncbi:tetratricopeptide repeat protein [Desulfobaculum bizertense]|uniref:tetratricopeptide repeat protein n=1 Tax=Desulfobaculum bizertense TaxID=376490 RepID=UPI001F25B1B3|nr:tetratricopeptide repeat protein [Desulfobaculum bizertense]UIJ38363.1 tetratricopeptide repeat protein [Desulfobaculum bizertense]